MAKPYVGQSVVVRGHKSNGTDLHPGVITRVWGDNDPSEVKGVFACVNIKVFPDCAEAFDATSTYFFNTEPDRERYPFAAWPAV